MNDMTIAQPINGSRGATVAGPRNIPLEVQVPDIFAALPTDHGSIPNLHFPFAFAHNRLEDGGWAREVTMREMPAMKEMAIVNMRLGPGVGLDIGLRCHQLLRFKSFGFTVRGKVAGSAAEFLQSAEFLC